MSDLEAFMLKPKCPVCGVGRLTRRSSIEPFEHKGTTLTYDSQYDECSQCGTEMATVALAKENLARKKAATKA